MKFLTERKLNESGEYIEYKGYDLNISDIGSLEDIRELGTGTVTIDVEVYKDGKRLGVFRGLRAARAFVDKEYFKSMKARLIRAIESWKLIKRPSEYYTGPDTIWFTEFYPEAEECARDDEDEPGVIYCNFGVGSGDFTGNDDFKKYISDDLYVTMFSTNLKPFDYKGKWEAYPYFAILSMDGDLGEFYSKTVTGGPYLEFPFDDIKKYIVKLIEEETESTEVSLVKDFIEFVEREED